MPATTIKVGNYAVSDCAVSIKTAGETFTEIEDLSEMNLAVEGNIEEWNSLKGKGWGNALMTAKKISGSFAGKRCIGDAGNDFLFKLAFENPSACVGDWKVEFPDGSTLEFTSVIEITDILGAATDAAPLNGNITGKGKPNFTPAAA